MSLTPEQVTALPAGTQVTLTYQPPTGPPRIWHMQVEGHPMVVAYDNPRTLMLCGQRTDEPGATRWNRFSPIWTDPRTTRYPRPEWFSDGNALLSLGSITMRPDAAGWTVTALTDQGQQWASQSEPASLRRDRLIEQVRDLDPALAATLNATISDLISEARQDGAADERAYRY